MRVLLLSSYELGHQPLHVASPAGALRRAGIDVSCLDLSVEPFDPAVLDDVDAVGVSVPMHTAMRLGCALAGEIRRRRPALPICFYGLYAAVGRDRVVGRLADRVIVGEYEPALVAWARSLAEGTPHETGGPVSIHLGRTDFARPARDLLPSLDRYARMTRDGEERLVGYVETTHGCSERCRHCPVPAVYDGRTRLVRSDVVLADVAHLVEMGAGHLTIGDPDFLAGPVQALRFVAEVHAAHPDLTFDVTTKVEHILRHESIWPEMAALGCVFVVTAIECVDDETLTRLDKGHTAADASRAVRLLREHGIEPRPSFLPFTPWTVPADVADLLTFVVDHDLVANVDPVHYSLRLLIPDGSLLVDHPDVVPHLTEYDPDLLTWTWRSADPAVDDLQARLSTVAAEAARDGADPCDAFPSVVDALGDTVRPDFARRPDDLWRAIDVGDTRGRPRLTEPWFC